MPPDPAPPELPANPPADRPRPARVHAPRLPGTYAANFEQDMDWHRAVAVLWVFVGLAAVGEAVNAAFYLLRGSVDYPPPYEAGRLVAEAALFLSLWLGWGWLRWLLAVNNFFYGAWLVVWLIAAHARDPNALPDTPPPAWGIASIPALGTAVVYLCSAVYLAFSADVLDFLRHRREEGRGWVVVPIMVGMGAYLLALFNAQSIYLRWIEHERAAALAFVTESVKTISSDHWAEAAYEARADPEYLKTWFDGDRKEMFGRLSRLGEFRRLDHPSATVGSATDATGGGFVVHGQVELGPVEFTHGGTVFIIDVTRSLFGPWQMQGFDAGNPRFDPVPR